MIKNLLSILLLTMLSLTAGAQTSIGYSNGTIGRDYVMRVGGGEVQAMAMRLSHEKLQTLVGKHITAVEAVYGSRNTTGNKATVFVTTDLNNVFDSKAATQPIATAETSIPTNSATKWAATQLPSAYTITGEEPELYIGTYMTIASTYQALSSDKSADNAGTSFALKDGKWIDIDGLGFGSLNIRAVIGETLNTTDAVLKTFSINGYYKAGDSFDFSAEVFNFGQQNITSFDVSAVVDGGTPVVTHHEGLSIAPQKTYTIALPKFEIEGDGKVSVDVTISNINGANDTDVADNSVLGSVYFYPKNMERALLVEEFTGQLCPNCPSGQTALHNYLAKAPEKYVQVNHHSGYQPDIYTMADDYEYTWFYNNGGQTYAPAAMVNRTVGPGLTVAVYDPRTTSALNGTFLYCMKQQPYVSLDLKTDYNEATRELTVKFNIYCHNDLPLGNNVLNLILVQDGLVALQAASSGYDYNYVHNAVSRGSLLGNAWGGILPATLVPGTNYEHELKYTLPEKTYSDYYGASNVNNASYNIATDPSKMYVVGYVGHYNATSVDDNVIYNAIRADIGKSTTQQAWTDGIEQLPVDMGANAVTRVYDMQGRLVDAESQNLPAGLYIIRTSDGKNVSSKKVLVK